MPLEKGRRSSILKPSKVRNPLGELDQLRPSENDDDGHTTTETIRNRRVSFSHKKGVALFTSEEGNTIWHNIYEEHNKPDLSDSGGGSRLHISLEGEVKQEVKQEPTIHFNAQDDDNDDDHCVDIQAILSGIRKPIEREPPNLVLELTQPSISDKTEVLINYKIPHDSITDIKMELEEPLVKIEAKEKGDILFDESQAEMSITQDIPSLIVTNEVKKVPIIKKTAFDISMVEDRAKFIEDKENIVMQECLDNLEDRRGDENIGIKPEIIYNESIHIEDYFQPGAKRSMLDLYQQDFPDKKIKCESTVNLHSDSIEAKTELLEENDPCDMSITCFTKEVKMNNKRETIGYNVRNVADLSMISISNDGFDPLADVKSADVCIKSNRPSEMFNRSVQDPENESNFEFVMCDEVNVSLKEEDLNESDILNVDLERDKVKIENQESKSKRKTIIFDNDDDKCNMSMTNVLPTKILTKGDANKSLIGAKTKTILFDENPDDCNMSMTDIVSKMELNLDRGKYSNQENVCVSGLQTKNIYKDNQVEMEMNKENYEINPEIIDSGDRKNVLFDPSSSECKMSITSVFPPLNEKLIQAESKLPKSNTLLATASSLRNDRNTIHYDPNDLDCNMSMTSVLPLRKLDQKPVQGESELPECNNRKTIHSNPNDSDCNLSMTFVLPLKKLDGRSTQRESELPEPSILASTGPCSKNNRKTIHFNPDNSDCNMSMTSVLPLKKLDERPIQRESELTESNILASTAPSKNNRKTIHFNPDDSDCNMSMTSVLPLRKLDEKPVQGESELPEFNMLSSNAPSEGNKRKTIHFNPDDSDCNMSMTSVLPLKKLDERPTQRESELPESNMLFSNAPSAGNKRKTIHFNPDDSDCNMSMTSVLPLKKLDERPSQRESELTESNILASTAPSNNERKTIHFNPDDSDCNMSMTSVFPLRKLDEKPAQGESEILESNMLSSNAPSAGNKRKTIHFNPDDSDCNMSMTSVMPLRKLDEKPIQGEPELLESNMLSSNAPSAGNKRKTIHFNPDDSDCNMSMTSVMPLRKLDEKPIQGEPELLESNMLSSNAPSAGNKRKTIHFNPDDSDCNMSMTSVMPLRKLDEKPIQGEPELLESNMLSSNAPSAGNKRKTIHFNPDDSDCNMSMTSVLPLKKLDERPSQRESELTESNILASTAPSNNNRKTIHFNPNVSDCNMSMKNILALKHVGVDEVRKNLTESSSSVLHNSKKSIALEPKSPNHNLSFFACVSPLSQSERELLDAEKNSRNPRMHIDTRILLDMCDQGGITIHNESNLSFDSNKSCNNIPHPKPIGKSELCYDVTMKTMIDESSTEKINNTIFDKDSERRATSNVILSDFPGKSQNTKRKVNTGDLIENNGLQEEGVSASNVAPTRTIHFGHGNPNSDTPFTNEASIPNFDVYRSDNVSIDIEHRDMSVKNKGKSNLLDQELPDTDMSMSNVACINKRKTKHFDHNMPDSNMSMTSVAPILMQRYENTKDINGSKYFTFDQNLSKVDMSMASTSLIQNKYDNGKNDEQKTTHFSHYDARSDLSMINANHSNAKQEVFYRNQGKTTIDSMPESRIHREYPFMNEECANLGKNYCEIENMGSKSIEISKTANSCEDVSSTNLCENINISRKVDITISQDVNRTTDKYFEQACKDLLDTRHAENSLFSMSSIMPRIAPGNANFNMTVNSMTSFMPNINDSQSVLFDNDMENVRIMEISKCFKGYRDPCKSANNSIYGADKSNMSLPNIDDSGLGNQLINEDISPRLPPESQANTTSNSFALLVADFDEKSIFREKNSTETKLQMTYNQTLQHSQKNNSVMVNMNETENLVNITLPKITDNTLTKIDCKEDFHMSIDEMQMPCNISDICSDENKPLPLAENVTRNNFTCKKYVEETIEYVKNNEERTRDTFVKKYVEKNSHNINPNNLIDDFNVKTSATNVNRETEIKQIDPIDKSGDQLPAYNEKKCSNLELENNRQCENVFNKFDIYKKNIEDIERSIADSINRINADTSIMKASEKRKSNEDANVDAFNFSLPKKQKIVPEVCSWLKEISITNSTVQADLKNPFDERGQDIDSQTYTISRSHLEHFVKIKKLNDDLHDDLNGSDHFIENVNMSLVDSSLDKSNSCNSCGKIQNTQEKNSGCVNCHDNSDGDEENKRTDHKNTSVAQNTDKECTQNLGDKVSLCESLRTSTETVDSPLKLPNKSYVNESKSVDEHPKNNWKQAINDVIANLDMCDVEFDFKEVTFSMMRGLLILKIVFQFSLPDSADHMVSIADILLIQNSISGTKRLYAFRNMAVQMALLELDLRSLKAMCVVSSDVPNLVNKCHQVAEKAWLWSKECYTLYVKYNLHLVDDYKWVFEICDGYHLCAWDFEVRLQNKKMLLYTKPENIKIKTGIGKSKISESDFRRVFENISPGWMFLPDLISKLHELIRSTR